MMEEEEGYMVLHLKPRKEHGKHNVSSHAQGTPQHKQWHQVALGVASVVILLLMGAVITLAIWVLQSKETKCRCDSEFRLQLKYFVCSSPDNSTEEDVKKCKICPENWKLHRESCYWSSEQTKTWAESQEDCRAKNSTLVVIQNTEEKVFIENFTRRTWLGLTVKSSEYGTWEWVDGSPLEKALFSILGSAEENSCLMKIENNFYSENCGTQHRWICEKIAFQI